jgi:DNA-binding MarR family transcriptional regulator
VNPIETAARHPELVRVLDMVLVGFDQSARRNRTGVIDHVSRLVGQNMSYTTLLILERMKEDATTRMTELASSVGVAGATITRQIQELERTGLVLRLQDEQDGRASVVRLTEAGHRVAEVSSEARRDLLRESAQGWSDDELEQMIVFHQRLQDGINRFWTRRNSVSVPGDEQAVAMP